jgi:hypothetical protein
MRCLLLSRCFRLAMLPFLTLGLNAGIAEATEIDDATLRGIPGLSVLVDVNPIAESSGIDSATLRKDLELRLKGAGVSIFEQGSVLDQLNRVHSAGAFLYLNVNAAKSASDVLCWAVQFQVLQPARLNRDSTIVQPLASTWGNANDIGCGSYPVLRTQVLDLADKFINAWLSVNLKK